RGAGRRRVGASRRDPADARDARPPDVGRRRGGGTCASAVRRRHGVRRHGTSVRPADGARVTAAAARGVTFVVPVHNGALWIRETLESILAQADGRPMDVIVVDDRSGDGSAGILRRLAAIWPIRIVEGPGRGAAAAINAGLRAARFPIVLQVDQDVVLRPGWMSLLAAELDDEQVAAAQGYYATDREATLCARVMGF